MKKLKAILYASTIFLAACGSLNQESGSKMNDSTTVNESANVKTTDVITGKMTLVSTPKVGDPIDIKFTVYNRSDTAAKFCKWHTPYERLMSKYVDVTMEDGTEPNYKGAMAKRIMPPPADSYITLKPGDSTSVNFNLADAFSIDKAGRYTIKYNSTNISGIVVENGLELNLIK